MVTTGELILSQTMPQTMSIEEGNIVIVFEGPDKSGKSTIAQHFAERYNFNYYKNPRERQQKLAGEIRYVAKYAGLWYADYIRQVPQRVIIDRHYISEWVYSHVEQRERDDAVLREIDKAFASIGAFIIICYRDDYTSFIDETTPTTMLPQLAEAYKLFPHWSQVKNILFLNTTNELLDEQCEKIKAFIEERR